MILITIMILRKKSWWTTPAPIDMFKLPFYIYRLKPSSFCKILVFELMIAMKQLMRTIMSVLFFSFSPWQTGPPRNKAVDVVRRFRVDQTGTLHKGALETLPPYVIEFFNADLTSCGHKIWLHSMIIFSDCSQRLSIWVRWYQPRLVGKLQVMIHLKWSPDFRLGSCELMGPSHSNQVSPRSLSFYWLAISFLLVLVYSWSQMGSVRVNWWFEHTVFRLDSCRRLTSRN